MRKDIILTLVFLLIFAAIFIFVKQRGPQCTLATSSASFSSEYVIADAVVYGTGTGTEDINYGNEKWLGTNRDGTGIGPFANSYIRSYFMFDISNITKISQNTKVLDSNFCIYIYSAQDTWQDSIHHLRDNWEENTISGLTEPCRNNPLSSPCNSTAMDTKTIDTTANTRRCFNMTTAVDEAQRDGLNNVSILLKRGDGSTDNNWHEYHSKEGAQKPYFAVSYMTEQC